MPQKYVINLDGTIGVGKTTFGRILASRFAGQHLDGDDFRAYGKPWYASSFSTCKQLRAASIKALSKTSVVFISRPMRCLDWVYFHHHFQLCDIRFFSIGLQADYKSITAPQRGRLFSEGETTRMQEMITQGYGIRPYSEHVFRTDQHTINDTAKLIEQSLRKIIIL